MTAATLATGTCNKRLNAVLTRIFAPASVPIMDTASLRRAPASSSHRPVASKPARRPGRRASTALTPRKNSAKRRHGWLRFASDHGREVMSRASSGLRGSARGFQGCSDQFRKEALRSLQLPMDRPRLFRERPPTRELASQKHRRSSPRASSTRRRFLRKGCTLREVLSHLDRREEKPGS
jgi:hypothetical protein